MTQPNKALKASAVRAEEAIIVDAQVELNEAILKAKLKRKDLADRLNISEARAIIYLRKQV